MDHSSRDITECLRAWGDGDVEARDRVVALVYAELRRRAAAYIRREPRGRTLQVSDLVHETYVRLAGQDRADWHNRGQFFGIASAMMRRILVDRARAHRTAKRSGHWIRIPLQEARSASQPLDIDVLDLDRALRDLTSVDPRKSRLVELRFFGGLSLPEASAVIGVSVATAERDWQVARAWLFAALGGQRQHDA